MRVAEERTRGKVAIRVGRIGGLCRDLDFGCRIRLTLVLKPLLSGYGGDEKE